MPWSRALAAAGGLPVAAHIGRMRQALDASAARSGGAPALVVQAPPGSPRGAAAGWSSPSPGGSPPARPPAGSPR